MSREFEAVVGLEIHVQVNTKRKAFCSCSTAFGEDVNGNICPVCTGQPGALPVLNREFVKKAVLFSRALNADVNLTSTFDRKNYFYPDTPKNYQITQFFTPIGEEGNVSITGDDGKIRPIGIERLHMEEDSGKSMHLEDRTLLNFNRAGVPLVEIVSKPEMHSGREASEYFKKIYLIAVKYLGLCNGNMEEGNLRCDANVSIRPKGSTDLYTKTEIKNVNSFSFIQKAVDYEIERQVELVNSGGKVEEETRLWNAAGKKTELMRKKYGRNDYRYFNEPDLGPLRLDEKFVAEAVESMPELPDAKAARFRENYALNDELMELLIGYPEVSAYFEKAAACYEKGAKKIASWIAGELLRVADKENLADSKISPEMVAELVRLIDSKRINQAQAKEVFEMMAENGKKPEEIVESDPKFKAIDSSEIEGIIDGVISSNQKEVEAYRGGKKALLGFFVGQVMKASKGKADPASVNKILREKLEG